MKKMPLTLLIALCATPFANGATAQNQPLACQTEAAAGLKWENGRWVSRTFEEPKFILVQAGNTLTTDSVAKAINSPPNQITCRNDGIRSECTDRLGSALFFDPRTLTGGLAQLYGSVMQSNNKDTVSLQIFSCTPF